MQWYELVLRPSVLPFAIPIVAILVVGLIKITKMIIVHRERMAKLQLDIDPDKPPV